MLPFDISSVVLCDDVRREDNGKLLLIGVYVHSVLVQDFPASVPLTLWMELIPKDLGKLEGQIRIVADNGAVLLRGQSQTTFSELKPTSATFGRMPVEFQQEGECRFQWKFGEGDWQTVKEFAVRKREISKIDANAS